MENAENQDKRWDPLSDIVDSFWASLPEKTADDLASFKKDVLTGIKDTVTRVVDEEIKRTDGHLENARRMREEWRSKKEADEAPPNPA